jgi:hypothetical protein
MKIAFILLSLASLIATQQQAPEIRITTSDAIDLARVIAQDEGYDVSQSTVYSFDLLTSSKGTALLKGYTSIGFNINGNPRNLIVISNSTGQSLDYNTCEVFEYPDLRGFQDRMMQLSKAKKKSAQELAKEAGCGSPKVLTTPVPVSK